MKILHKPEKQGNQIHRITPAKAGWQYVGCEVYMLKEKDSVTIQSNGVEMCIVIISGIALVENDFGDFHHMVGQRMCPFEKKPPYSIYISAGNTLKFYAKTDLEVVVGSSPSDKKNNKKSIILPQEINIEKRGYGHNQRLVHNILPDSNKLTDNLIAVEVYTNEGNTSSYPSHKHDETNDQENYLEETYYHRFQPSQGFALQRVYSKCRKLDVCVAPYDRDIVLVPYGYHPVATIAGYNNYYLNFMAGPVKKWKFTWEKEHKWVNSEKYHQKGVK